jgi:hypothetical protein
MEVPGLEEPMRRRNKGESMKQPEKLVRQGEQYLRGLAATYRRCWQAACRYDGLDPDAAFVCFSCENPYVPYLGRIFQQYQENLQAFGCWGYVGLTIANRSGVRLAIGGTPDIPLRLSFFVVHLGFTALRTGCAEPLL